ncbi:hypothetical protein SVIO_036570 [Streptomyces violaceusniger]|uniref:Glycosyl hydrolase family 13 catalytic domain-containing protein n=1 Tax=Streptomyces violaceusniger TaxID=68280 RepID=A0A4D4KXY6_STRVO|nr:hypothetical protein SVIO_036570 [Streptomyces violaceusniger]
MLRFWLDLGVDGFRIDVAHGMVKAAGLPDIGHTEQAKLIGSQVLPFFDQDGVHEIHRSWRRLLDSYPGDRIGVAEAWAPTSERLALYVRPDELHQAFNFQFLKCPWDAAAMREVIDESLAATGSVGAPPPGCSPTTTWSGTPPATPTEPVAARSGGSPAPAPRPCSSWRCPGRPISTRARSWACPR